MNYGPIYAITLSPGWVDDKVLPEFRSDIFPVDTSEYCEFVRGTSNMFFFVGVSRNRWGFELHARAMRILEDGCRASWFEIAADPEVVRHRRTLGNATCTISTLGTGGGRGILIRIAHPAPNEPAVRGV